MLVALDVDGVLVPIKSSWQYVHERLGTTREAMINYRLFMNGKIGYWEWMYLDTLAWIEARPGITIWDLVDIFRSVNVKEDALCGVRVLRDTCNTVIALISGGVNVLVERVARTVRADYWFSPKLAFDPQGRLVPGGEPLVEADRKDRILRKLASMLGIPIERTVFIGDSIWDLRGMKEAGFSVAVNTSDERVLAVASTRADNLCQAAQIIVERYCKE